MNRREELVKRLRAFGAGFTGVDQTVEYMIGEGNHQLEEAAIALRKREAEGGGPQFLEAASIVQGLQVRMLDAEQRAARVEEA